MASQPPVAPQYQPQSQPPVSQSGAPLTTICPVCRTQVPTTDFFCPNCGKPLREPPLKTTIWKQINIYFVALFLPPFGFWYVWKYMRSQDPKAREIGIVTLVLTVLAIGVGIWMTITIMNSLNQAVNQALGSYGGLGNLGF